MTDGADIDLADQILRAVHERTSDRLRDTRVVVTGGAVTVHGIAPSFYLKQLALEAARTALRGLPVVILLEMPTHAR